LGLSDELTESAHNGLNQLEVQGKNILKILGVELEGVNGINSLDGVKSRLKIESRHRSKGLSFAYLADQFPVSLDRHAALQNKINRINGLTLAVNRLPGRELDFLGQSSHATKFFCSSVLEDIY